MSPGGSDAPFLRFPIPASCHRRRLGGHRSRFTRPARLRARHSVRYYFPRCVLCSGFGMATDPWVGPFAPDAALTARRTRRPRVRISDSGPSRFRPPIDYRAPAGETWSSSWAPTPPRKTSRRSWRSSTTAGGDAFVSRGVSRTIIGLVGDVDQFATLNLRGMRGVADVMRVSAPYKLVSRDNHPETVHRPGRRRADRPGHGHADRRPVCGGDAAADAGGGRRWPRPPGPPCCAAAPTSPVPRPTPSRGSARRACGSSPTCASETGLPIVTEVVDAHDVELVASYADMLQVGTRNAQNFALLQAVGAVGQAGHAQARHERHHRGVADGRRVHRPARQPRHRAVRARHPHLRDRHPQHPGRLRGPGRPAAVAPAGHRRPVPLRRPPRSGPAAHPRGHRGRRRRRDHRRPPAARSRRCATAPRRWSTATWTSWPA